MNTTVKRLLYVIAAVSLGVAALSAFRLVTRASAGSDPFQGISAAEDAPVVVPSAAALQQMSFPAAGAVPTAARQLPSMIAGHAAYVLPSTYGGFCLFVEQLAEGCGGPLTANYPALFVSFDPGGGSSAGTTAYGVAEDGVISITMTVNGSPVTVPVKGNTFEFSAGPSVTPDGITTVTANFGDGHSMTLGN